MNKKEWNCRYARLYKMEIKIMHKILLVAIICSIVHPRSYGSYGVYSNDVFSKVKDSIVIIEGNKGSGTGFVVEIDDGIWLMTNEHVIQGQEKLSFRTLSGDFVMVSNQVFISTNRDIARFRVIGNHSALRWRNSAPRMGESIWVYGNSDGGHVATDLSGTVSGVGDDRIEVSAKFVSGNSGSPVVDRNGDVVGIATYAELKREPENWIKSDTRFNEVRRFAYILSGCKWESLNYAQYLSDWSIIDDVVDYCVILLDLCECHRANCVRSGGDSYKNNNEYGFYSRRDKTVFDCDRQLVAFKTISDLTGDDKIQYDHNRHLQKALRPIILADIAFDKELDRFVADHASYYNKRDGSIGGSSHSTLQRRNNDLDAANKKQVAARRDMYKRIISMIESTDVCGAGARRRLSTIKKLLEECRDDFKERVYELRGCRD